MSSSNEEKRERIPVFNPKASAFTPTSNSFPLPKPVAANPVLNPSERIFNVGPGRESPSSFRQVYPGVYVPNLEHPPLADLSPMPRRSQRGKVEALAMNLRLPLAPSSRVGLLPSPIPEEGFERSMMGQYSGSNQSKATMLDDSTHSAARRYVHQDEETGPPFPPDTGAQGGLDDLAQHMHNTHLHMGYGASYVQASSEQVLNPPDQFVPPGYYDANVGLLQPGSRHGLKPWFGPSYYSPQVPPMGGGPFTPPTAPRAMMNAPGPTNSPSAAVMGSPFSEVSRGTPRHKQQGHHRRQSRRRSSGFSRGMKRADQGPEASPADIYPEDALPSYPPMPLANLWPTPAEGLKKETKLSDFINMPPSKLHPDSFPQDRVSHSCFGTFNDETKENRKPPSSIGTLSPITLVNRGKTDELVMDARPLTPGQLDGSRYGLKFGGLGFHDTWQPRYTQGVEPCQPQPQNQGNFVVPWPKTEFRTRPRGKEGWGGRKWGEAQGWVLA